jgi:hypothetical protein
VSENVMDLRGHGGRRSKEFFVERTEVGGCKISIEYCCASWSENSRCRIRNDMVKGEKLGLVRSTRVSVYRSTS